MTKFLALAVVLMAGCGGVSAVATAPDGGAGAGAAGGLSGGAGDGAQAGAAPGSGGGGAGGAAGNGSAGGGGSDGIDAGAAGASSAGTSGAGGAASDASTDTGAAKAWCEVGYPSDAPPDCESVSGAPSDAFRATLVDCPGLPKVAVPTFGTLTCARCRTPSGHSLDKCLGVWGTQQDHQICSVPGAYCVALCSECP